MAKRKRRTRPPRTGDIAIKVRIALRSIIRDWKTLCEPLPVDKTQSANEGPRFRVRGAESYEELQERVVEFAGRVWQLKDGLIHWLETRPDLRVVFTDANTGTKVTGSGGNDAERTIEAAANLSVPLLLCADLYNAHKHYTDCNRSGYQPFLNGVRFDTSRSGVCGIRYDGAQKIGEITVTNPNPVRFRVELHSRSQPVDFGDAVVNVGRAFNHWIPLIREMGLLSPDAAEDRAILNDLALIQEAAARLSPFDQDEPATRIDLLPTELRRLATEDPAAFIQAQK